MNTLPDHNGSQKRIHSIDAVRALALLGILLVHCGCCFGALPQGVENECVWGGVDRCVSLLIHCFMSGRARLAFSFLFGLSFFLQMDHAAAKGIDFRKRFCWRLLLLLGFSFFHNLFYPHDILTDFVFCGFILVLVWKLKTWAIVAFSLVCLSSPVSLWEYCSGNEGVFSAWCSSVRDSLTIYPSPSLADPSLAEHMKWNAVHAQMMTLFVDLQGSLFAILGMFLLGMTAGRLRIFEGNPRLLLRIAACGFVLWAAACLFHIGFVRDSLRNSEFRSPEWWSWWLREIWVFFFIPMTAWIFSHEAVLKRCSCLTAIGRCTLSCYITQGIALSWFFYDWGLGMHSRMGATDRFLIGLAVYAVQLAACTLWLRHFKYGPLEGVWRRLTRIGMK
ncbi:MAG: DUF418 domain-containing protein [Akkermansiaceae bacterium]|nr:DUF418 domain-containing protein [Akkermansiaceae bacterium]